MADDEAHKANLAVWREIAKDQRAGAEFRLHEAVTIGGYEVPEGTEVKVWRVAPNEPARQSHQLGTFFLADHLVSIRTTGAVTATAAAGHHKIARSSRVPRELNWNGPGGYGMAKSNKEPRRSSA